MQRRVNPHTMALQPRHHGVEVKQKFVQRKILSWFRTHKRDLPWRRTHDPYRILVSEIMLQQTQVDRVLPKYAAFLKRFPTLQNLARAKRSSVIKAWSGLGYNNRAIWLHRAAQEIVRRGKRFPKSFDDLIHLPGVGSYTARAVQSFAFGEHVATVDVNHARVLRRFFFGAKSPPLKKIEKLATSLVPTREAYRWNQAMMDFGALVCKARPICAECPLRAGCKAFPAILKVPRRRKSANEPFQDSNRYFRGRIVETLRKLPHNKLITEDELLQRIRSYRNILPERFRSLIADLVRDGVLVIESRRYSKKVRLA